MENEIFLLLNQQIYVGVFVIAYASYAVGVNIW